MRILSNNEVLANSEELFDKGCLMQLTERLTILVILPLKDIAQWRGSTAHVRRDLGLRERQLTSESHNICNKCQRGYSKTEQENNKCTVTCFPTLKRSTRVLSGTALSRIWKTDIMPHDISLEDI